MYSTLNFPRVKIELDKEKRVYNKGKISFNSKLYKIDFLAKQSVKPQLKLRINISKKEISKQSKIFN